MKSIFKSQFWALLLMGAMAVGCTESPIDEVGGVDAPLADPVEVSLNLRVKPLSAGTKEAAESGELTESRATEDLGFSETIKNLWVIQFNGTADSCKVVGTPLYLDNYDELTDNDRIVTLIPSVDSKSNTVVYIANTFSKSIGVVAGTELGAYKKMAFTANSEDGCFVTDGGTKYMLMNGSEEIIVGESNNTLVGELKRSLAKIEVKIVDNSKGAITLKSTRMNNVVSKIPYLASQAAVEGVATPFPLTSATMDYDSRDLEFSNGVATVTYYIPCNMQGVVTNNNTETTKPLIAPTYATYLDVVGQVDDKEYSYTFFLGENMTYDFNIKPNFKYTYTFTFDGAGDPSSDNRIESLGDIDYRQRESSNCYILNPSATKERSYIIPIEERIRTFWTEYAGFPREVNSSNWDIEYLWYDCDLNPIADATETTLESNKIRVERVDDPLQQESMKVTLGAGFRNYGNVVVAIREKKSDGTLGDIFWSWHFWITDYDPDSKPHTPLPNEHVYKVANGEIHRYDGELWEEGKIYGNSFIMDRDLGAMSTAYAGSGRGSLYYHFGRKDPFPGSSATYLPSVGVSDSKPNSVGTSDGVTFETVATNPSVYYYINDGGAGKNGYNWCCEESSWSLDCLWNDVKLNKDDVIGKSIFDPSPLGWKLPIRNVLDGFTNETFPRVGDSRVYGGYAVYNFSGYRTCASKFDGVTSVGGAGYIVYSTPVSIGAGFNLYSTTSGVTINMNHYRTYGFATRCVKDIR